MKKNMALIGGVALGVSFLQVSVMSYLSVKAVDKLTYLNICVFWWVHFQVKSAVIFTFASPFCWGQLLRIRIYDPSGPDKKG